MELIIKVGIALLNLIYKLFKLLPQQDKVTIISRQSNDPSLDIEMVSRKIPELYPEYKVIVLCKLLGSSIGAKIKYIMHMFVQMYHIATSKIIILDSYCILVSILDHRKSLKIFQMWHSIGTMKKFGYSILDKTEGSSSKIAHLMKMHANYDYIFAAGDGYRDHLSQGFNYPIEKIVTMPLPRVEVLKNKDYAVKTREKIYTVYPQLKAKKTITYMPTLRKVTDSDLVTAMHDLCHSIDYDKYNLVIKAHPLTDLADFDSSLAIVDHSFSSFDMLFVSDIIISDYSCIMYEAAVLKKPIYLYAYDYDEYMETRDIYMDFDAEVPGPICRNATELITHIDSGNYDYDKLDRFLNKYVYMGSDHETEDMVKFIFEH